MDASGFRTLPTLAIALLCAAASTPAAASPPVPGPSGQFLPSVGDRDGDGLPDAADCAPDDPSRPARAGVDADCDGAPDSGFGPIVISGPADGAPDDAEQQAASRPSSSVHAAALARRAAHGPVARLRWKLGPLAAFAPRHQRHASRTFVFVARDNVGLTAAPVLDSRRLAVRHRSVARGRTYVLRIATRSARRLRLTLTVVDAAGRRHRSVRTLRL